jgi:hypothetical protein
MTAEASVTGEIGTAWWVSQAERRVPDVDDNSPGQHEHVGFGARQKGPTCAREKGPTPRSQFSLAAADA